MTSFCNHLPISYYINIHVTFFNPCFSSKKNDLYFQWSFLRSDLDNLFQIQSIDKEAKTFWPNICCKERKDKTLKVCEDPTGKIKRDSTRN